MSPNVRRSIQFMSMTMTWTMRKATRNLTRGQMRYFMKTGLIAPPHGNLERRMRMQNEENGRPLAKALRFFSILHSHSAFRISLASSIDLPKHDIDRPNQRH